MRAQLISHEFRTFTSPKTGKTYELNEYKFLGIVKGKKDVVKVSRFGPEDKSVSLDAIYELTPEAYTDKLGFLAWGTAFAIAPAAK